MSQGRSIELGEQIEKEESIDGSQENKGRSSTQKVVQGRLERCSFGEVLRETEGRKARNTILQAIKACKLKDSCHCWRNVQKPEKLKNFRKKETGSTSW